MAKVKISNDGTSPLQEKPSSLLLENNSDSFIGADVPTGITQSNFIKPQPLTSREINKLDHGQRLNSILRSIKASVVSKVLDISEFSTKFNVSRFIRVIIYHFLFWYFGPLVVVPLICIFDSYGLSQNMGFWFAKEGLFVLINQLIVHSATLYMFLMQVLKRFGVTWSSNKPLIDGIYLE